MAKLQVFAIVQRPPPSLEDEVWAHNFPKGIQHVVAHHFQGRMGIDIDQEEKDVHHGCGFYTASQAVPNPSHGLQLQPKLHC